MNCCNINSELFSACSSIQLCLLCFSCHLLLTQLLLFLPVITLNFGWLYWRLDMGARAKGSQQIKFAEDDAAPRVFDYFYIATRTLMQFEPTGAEARSRAMKALFVLHGIMMLDLMALTLSRAIALASGD